ncbi:hypothetical protein CEXT_650601 [Caerostris extrusa]|uniref:Uncharacterized protein n=1 Tax=Caerostris extrusa TaxID=172846 RepID=A0AAV4MHQ2_CAEEX|nr:hypothetical protein CEXT_650601 [Caerostris extrusa]
MTGVKKPEPPISNHLFIRSFKGPWCGPLTMEAKKTASRCLLDSHNYNSTSKRSNYDESFRNEVTGPSFLPSFGGYQGAECLVG